MTNKNLWSVYEILRSTTRSRRLSGSLPRKHFLARERLMAAYRVWIEQSIDEVKRTKSHEWFRAMVHQYSVRVAGRHRGPRLIDDDGNVLRERGRL